MGEKMLTEVEWLVELKKQNVELRKVNAEQLDRLVKMASVEAHNVELRREQAILKQQLAPWINATTKKA